MVILDVVFLTVLQTLHGPMERLDQGHLHPLQEDPETNMSRPGIKPGVACVAGEHSSRDLFGTSTNICIVCLLPQLAFPAQSVKDMES
jgi:hypothetical protein